jgi:Protein of unknown function (DUF2924)
MKRNASRSETRSLAEELAALRGLGNQALKQRWRVLYRTEAPDRIGRALLLRAVAYRLQERALGGLRSSTRRLLERAAQDKGSQRPPTEALTTKVTPGSVLIREWHGVRVIPFPGIQEDFAKASGMQHRALCHRKLNNLVS